MKLLMILHKFHYCHHNSKKYLVFAQIYPKLTECLDLIIYLDLLFLNILRLKTYQVVHIQINILKFLLLYNQVQVVTSRLQKSFYHLQRKYFLKFLLNYKYFFQISLHQQLFGFYTLSFLQ